MSTSRPHEQNGFRVSWKLCLNLCWRKWLRPRRSLVRYLISLQLRQLNTLFRDSLINFNKFFLKTLRLEVLWRLRSNSFHSIKVDGKKQFLKKLYLVWKRVILTYFGYCNWNFLLVLDWKDRLVYFLLKPYKMSNVFCTIADVGGVQA